MRRVSLIIAFVAAILFGLPVNVLHATTIFPLEIFTADGDYYDSPDLDMYVAVFGVGAEPQVHFGFHNNSSIQSSIARIYFDDGSLLGIAYITEGPGTYFGYPVSPGDLPGGDLLEPPFETSREFCIGGDPPPSHNGIEPGEWVQISFDLVGGGTVAGVIDELNTGVLRIGVHIIALPDGSSESALAVPEPATLLLLGLGTLALLRKRRA